MASGDRFMRAAIFFGRLRLRSEFKHAAIFRVRPAMLSPFSRHRNYVLPGFAFIPKSTRPPGVLGNLRLRASKIFPARGIANSKFSKISASVWVS
jgi:hypothetical protein